MVHSWERDAPMAANRKAAIRAPLPLHKRNPAADPRKMRRIIAEDPNWSLTLVPPLSALCLQHIVTNFQNHPLLEPLSLKNQAEVLSRLSPALPLQVTAHLIAHEDYWRRRSIERWPTCDITAHGGSWKRLFFERHLADLLENFIPDLSPPGAICEAAQLCRDYVTALRVRQLLPPVRVESKRDNEEDEGSDDGSVPGGDLPSMDHFDFNLIAHILRPLQELHLVYGVRGCGLNFQWSLFTFTRRDCGLLANCFRVFSCLKVFSLRCSKVDDERVRTLVRGLLDHPSLEHLDLSHNLISDPGARAVAKLLNRSRLRALNLCDNRVQPHGARAIGQALSKNRTLHTLSLRLNHIGDEGAQALGHALLGNGGVATLNLAGNQLSEPTAAVMAQVLSCNRALRSLSLACNPIGLDGGKQLLEGMSENQTLLELDLRLSGVGQESEFFIQQILRSNRERAPAEDAPPPDL